MNTETMLRVEIEARNVWGKINYYVTSSNAAAISMLTGKKTVFLSDIRALEALGFVCVMAGKSEMPASEGMLS